MFKVLRLITVLLIFATSTLATRQHNIRVTSRAMSSLIDHFCENYHIRNFEVIVENDKFLIRLANEILRNTSSPLNVRKVNLGETFRVIFEHAQLFLLKSKKSMNKTIEAERLHTWSTQKNVKIVYFKDSIESTQEVSIKVGTPQFFYLLHNQINDSMMLHNQVYYEPGHCENWERVWKIVNMFDHEKLEWTTTSFLQKYDNFNNCPIPMILFLSGNNIQISAYKNENGEYAYFSGYFMMILQIFWEKYKIQFRSVVHNYCAYDDAICMSNGKVTGHTSYLSTLPLSTDHITFIVTRGSEYTPFEKLLLPFDLETWIMVIITFIIGYLTILIIYQCPQYVQDFVFGSSIRDPSMSLAQIFFGIGLIQTPSRNFARFLFMMFTLYCLIIRTAYQGKMFDFLHSKAEKSTPETMQDLIRHQIPIYYTKAEHVYHTDLATQL
jgi:hypothetical protein